MFLGVVASTCAGEKRGKMNFGGRNACFLFEKQICIYNVIVAFATL